MADFTIKNDGSQAMDGWTLQFTAPFNITNIWNAEIIERNGDVYTIGNASWNTNVAAGGEVVFGFQADPGGGSAVVSHVIINGTPGSHTGDNQVPDDSTDAGDNPSSGEPTVSVIDTQVTEADVRVVADGYFSTSGNQIIDATGNPVRIAGVSWFGFESDVMAPHGLWTRNMEDMMDEIKAAGFNTIRMPFSTESMQPGQMPSSINYAQNPGLQGLTTLELMDRIVEYADEIGLRIMLDHHRSQSGMGALGEDLWYTDRFSQDDWVNTWVSLVTRYVDNPSVIAVDLHNEPHGRATWGSGDVATDWKMAAERAGNAILTVNPDLLIVVEGIEFYNNQSYWWGGNLQGVRDHPIVLDQPDQLVYSPHAYPASIYNQPWFSDADYPDNLPDIWRQNWGFIYEEGIAPVLLGEFGSKLDTPTDIAWMNKMIDYIEGDLDGDGDNDLPEGSLGISYSYWSWNPNSGDTGGILMDDWRTIDQNKLGLLQTVLFEFPPTGQPDNSVAETTFAAITIELDQPATQTITVQYTTVAGTAQADVDFTPVNGTVTFLAGQSTATVLVPILGDTLNEDDETLTLTLLDADGAVLGDAVANIFILDNDSA